jgi:type II secretory pathway predicted ATPase ExeA
MIGYPQLSTIFDEDRLPPGQEPIVTTSVQKFYLQADFLMRSKRRTGYSMMGVVTGPPGVGKTVALRAFVDGLMARPHTGLPACIVIKVKPGSTPRQLVEDLLTSFGEKPRSITTNRYKIADEAAEAIVSYDLQGLFVDDAEQLDTDGFDFLRYIFAKTGCPIVVVGMPPIERVITMHEKFSGRVGLRLDFLPPDEEEVISTILPQLVLPGWSFDPTVEADVLLGRELWATLGPSLRNLRTVIQNASLLAELEQQPRITRALLKQSFQMTAIPKRREFLAQQEDQAAAAEEPQTEYETQSALRRAAKAKKNEESA